MTREERQKHANEISNKYVPGLLAADGKTMQEIAGLPIQDIITIHNNAIWAAEKGISLKSDMSAVETARKTVLKKIREAETLWTVTDRVTDAPFIDDTDSAWLFSEKEIADECVDYLMQQYRTTLEVTEIPGGEIEDFLGMTAYARGAGSFIIDNGRYHLVVRAEEIAVRPDFGTITSAENPVVNPVLFRSIAKFQQETLWKANYKGKAEKLKSFEADMIRAFCEARLIVPVKVTSKPESTDIIISMEPSSTDTLINTGTIISIPSLVNVDGRKATPVFTDWKELSAAYPGSEWSGWVWTIDDLFAAPDDTIVVNCKSLCFVATKKLLTQMKEANETVLRKAGTDEKDA